MSPPRILVVDDDGDVLAVVREVFELEGYAVETAVGGAAGMERLRAAPPDLMILDLMMPEFDGFAVLRERAQEPRLRAVPLLLLTARRDEDESALLQQGAQQVLRKPFELDSLLAAVKRLLNGTAPNPQ